MPKRTRIKQPQVKKTPHQTTAPTACVELISEIERLLPKMVGAVNELLAALSQEEAETGDAHHVSPLSGGRLKPPPGRWSHRSGQPRW